MNSEKDHNPNNLLLRRYQNGDKKALEFLIKRFHPVMIRTIVFYTGSREPAGDIAQECWYSIIPKLPAIKLEISFDAWALCIARRRAVDWIRDQKRTAARNRALQSENLAGFEDGVDDTDDVLRKKKLVQLRIRSLPVSQKIVLELFYLENLNLEEISNVLNVPAGTVKSRLFSARENLKRMINKQTEYEYEKRRNR